MHCIERFKPDSCVMMNVCVRVDLIEGECDERLCWVNAMGDLVGKDGNFRGSDGIGWKIMRSGFCHDVHRTIVDTDANWRLRIRSIKLILMRRTSRKMTLGLNEHTLINNL